MSDLTWFGYLVVIYWLLNAVLYVALIGQSIRFTAGKAVFALCVYSALIWGLFTVGVTS